MTEQSVKLPHSDWSPLVRRLALDDTRWPSRDATRRLTDKDVKLLRKIAEEAQAPAEVRLDKVLIALAERAPDAETAKVLQRVIGDRERPSFHRMIAAIGLGRIPTPISQPMLLAHADDADPLVAQRAIQALGKIGDTEGLKKLDAMKPPKDMAACRQWEFSKQLIRHRLGQAGKEAPRVVGTIWDTEGALKARPLPIQDVAPDRLKAAIDALRNEVFGTELADGCGYSIETDRSLQYLLMARPLTTKEGIKRLGEAPMVAAIIATWEPRTDKPVVDQIVLTQPFEGGVLVQGFRPDGTLLFEGQGTVRGALARFAITNVARAGQCRFRVAGQLGPDGLAAEAQTMPRQQARHTRSLAHAVA